MKKIGVLCQWIRLFIKKYPLSCTLFFFFSALTGVCNIAIIFLNGTLLDAATNGIQTKDFSSCLWVLLALVTVAALNFAFSYIIDSAGSYMNKHADIEIQTQLIRTVNGLDYQMYNSHQHKLMLAQAQQFNAWTIQSFFSQLQTLLRTVTSMVGAVFLILQYSFWGLIFSIAILGVNLLLSTLLAKKKQNVFFQNIMNNTRYTSLFSVLTGNIYLYESSLFQSKNFVWNLLTKEYTQVVKKNKELDRQDSIYEMISALILLCIFVASIVLCVLQRSISTVGQITVLAGALFTVQDSCAHIGNIGGSIFHSAGLYEKYRQYVEMHKEKVHETKDVPRCAPTNQAMIRVEHVAFQYENNEDFSLRDITFSVPPHQNVAIVGENGSGKSTLIKLLLGLYTPDSGRVFINGEPAGVAMTKGATTCVMQSFGRFNGLRVIDNVTMLDECMTQEEQVHLQAILHGVDLEAFVGTELGGTDLSGGQWQKIAILRALRKKAAIAVLDEPTAALDPIVEYELFQEWMEQFNNNGTSCVIVTHRLGIARNCDAILVMDHGKIIEQGTHDDLLRHKGKYFEMFQEQAKWYC